MNNRPSLTLIFLGVIIGAAAAALSLSVIGTTPASIFLGIPFSAVYIALFWLVFVRFLGWVRRPYWGMIAALLWGACFTLVPVVIGGEYYDILPAQLGFPQFSASFSGAFPEELGKALGILPILIACRQCDRPWHGLAIGTFIGLGFTLIEDVGYSAQAALYDSISDFRGFSEGWLIRIITGPAQHAVYTGIAGWGIGLATFVKDKTFSWRLFTAFSWFFLAFFLHFLWNAVPAEPWQHFIVFSVPILVGYPLYFYLILKGRRMAENDRIARASTSQAF